jgi:hypothetical protein
LPGVWHRWYQNTGTCGTSTHARGTRNRKDARGTCVCYSGACSVTPYWLKIANALVQSRAGQSWAELGRRCLGLGSAGQCWAELGRQCLGLGIAGQSWTELGRRCPVLGSAGQCWAELGKTLPLRTPENTTSRSDNDLASSNGDVSPKLLAADRGAQQNSAVWSTPPPAADRHRVQ